jgi:hypothetical protein
MKIIFYLGLGLLVVVGVILLKPKATNNQKGGVWNCHPNSLPFCVKGDFAATGFATEDECLKSCKYIPPSDEYYTCSGQTGTPPFTCVRTKTKTEWPVNDNTSLIKCQQNCFDATKYFRCTKSGDTPINTGGCEVARIRDEWSYQCAANQKDCTQCPESQACKEPQNWACDTGSYQCVPVPDAFCQPPIGNGSRKCYQTIPGQESTYAQYNVCSTNCTAPAPAPGPCDPAKCEILSEGKCVLKCTDCKKCDGAGNCIEGDCNCLRDKYCDKITNSCKKFTSCGTNPIITFDNTGQSRWYCPNGGWCADKTNPLYSRTVRTDNIAGICPDGSDCIKIIGESCPPQGSKGCWPTVDPTLISDLPTI